MVELPRPSDVVQGWCLSLVGEVQLPVMALPESHLSLPVLSRLVDCDMVCLTGIHLSEFPHTPQIRNNLVAAVG